MLVGTTLHRPRKNQQQQKRRGRHITGSAEVLSLASVLLFIVQDEHFEPQKGWKP